MIYLDVTSSCKSPMNTGVQRVVREIFRSLAAIAPVQPVLWDPGLASYCTLSAREHRFLVAPFKSLPRPDGPATPVAGDAEPGRRANPVPLWSKFARSLVHRWHRLDLVAAAGAGHTLFVPEIFQDNRLDWLEARAQEGAWRLVGICHDAIAWRRPDITPPARQAGFGRYLDVLLGFHRVVCVSKEVLVDLETYRQERGGGRAELSFENWPVDHAGAPRPSSAPPLAEMPSILCVATFEPRKNHLLLLAAAEILWRQERYFELVLIGRTTAHWGDRVLTEMAALQAAGRPVRWLRHVDDHTLNAAYAACRFTVFPSLIEGFGLPILESLWHGRPCICGRNGALGEVAADGGCLLVDQTNAAALADGMEWLLCDVELYARLQAEAQKRYFDNWERHAARILTLLVPKLQRRSGAAESCDQDSAVDV
jgi:glycosyltransferase involved in cell wall biosynthesis